MTRRITSFAATSRRVRFGEEITLPAAFARAVISLAAQSLPCWGIAPQTLESCLPAAEAVRPMPPGGCPATLAAGTGRVCAGALIRRPARQERRRSRPAPARCRWLALRREFSVGAWPELVRCPSSFGLSKEEDASLRPQREYRRTA